MRHGRRVVVVGGGASGGLVALQLLRLAGEGVEVTVLEPRPEIGLGAAFGTRDPWHRLNVPAVTMSALPDDLDHFRRWAGSAPEAFLPRMAWGRYLRELLSATEAVSDARLEHVRERAARLAVRSVPAAGPVAGPAAVFSIASDGGRILEADAVVVATGNETPRVPPSLEGIGGDPGFIADPWAPASLDGIVDGETVAIVGTGHTAIDLAATILRRRPACRLVAISRHGDLPRPHEDPWRPRPAEPVFDVGAFAAADDPFAFAVERIRGHPDGWRQGLDSLRPITVSLWRSLGEARRQEFTADWRHAWEVHRSRVPTEVMRDVEGWIAAGRLEVRGARIEGAMRMGDRLRIVLSGGDGLGVDRVLLATGPDERPAANPFLAAGLADGWLRAGPVGLGIDVDPDTLRVLDVSGEPADAIWAVGPVLRGALWESIAIPDIRLQAATVAAAVVETPRAG